ncbi:HYC_CC_PP family protein [Pontibacter chinhatensis]|uniref:HYC_CC_PP family protein n=1 Tax=Pontibacter chinhatensis TaxID=1436961 RepID=UPI000B8611F4|nr:hypothetical protein [Pontibacter chinhatensis]
MKNSFRHTVLLALSLSILLGSFGVALSTRFCEVTGLTPYAVAAQPDACCEHPEDGEVDDCCEKQVSYEKLEPVQEHKAFHLPQPLLAHSAALRPALPFLAAEAPSQRVYTYSDSSPPLYGRRLLHFLQTLIV